jgi:hypothetical protein
VLYIRATLVMPLRYDTNARPTSSSLRSESSPSSQDYDPPITRWDDGEAALPGRVDIMRILATPGRTRRSLPGGCGHRGLIHAALPPARQRSSANGSQRLRRQPWPALAPHGMPRILADETGLLRRSCSGGIGGITSGEIVWKWAKGGE